MRCLSLSFELKLRDKRMFKIFALRKKRRGEKGALEPAA
jgi:hypothetical protein